MSKHFLLTLFVGLLAFGPALAQTRSSVQKGPARLLPERIAQRVQNESDTLVPGSLSQPCGQQVFVFTVQNGGGYVAGTNNFGDAEKLQKYAFSGPAIVTGIEIPFGFKNVGTPTAAIRGKVYSVAPNGGPGTELAQSNPVLLSAIDTTGSTFFTFDSPPTVTDEFFVGFTVPTSAAAGDSISALMTNNGCFSGQQLAWERFSTGTFAPFNDGTNNTWQLDVDLLIFPIVEQVSSAADRLSGGLHLQGVYPQPNAGAATLHYTLPQAAEVTITVFDLTGKPALTLRPGWQLAGEQRTSLALPTLPDGLYVYRIETAQGRLTGKMHLAR